MHQREDDSVTETPTSATIDGHMLFAGPRCVDLGLFPCLPLVYSIQADPSRQVERGGDLIVLP